MRKIYIIDTNILCCLLSVKGKNVVGNGDEWNKKKIEAKLEQIEEDNESCVIPLPVLIETGNHIGNAKDYEAGEELIVLMKKNI